MRVITYLSLLCIVGCTTSGPRPFAGDMLIVKGGYLPVAMWRVGEPTTQEILDGVSRDSRIKELNRRVIAACVRGGLRVSIQNSAPQIPESEVRPAMKILMTDASLADADVTVFVTVAAGECRRVDGGIEIPTTQPLKSLDPVMINPGAVQRQEGR